MSSSRPVEDEVVTEGVEETPEPRKRSARPRRPRLRLIGGRDVEDREHVRRAAAAERRREQRRAQRQAGREGEEGTTTAEYTVVTGAAVAFGALLFRLLTSEWGNKILTTAFKHVISLLGF